MSINKTLKSVIKGNHYITLTEWNFNKMFESGITKYIVDIMDEKTGDVKSKEFLNKNDAEKYFNGVIL